MLHWLTSHCSTTPEKKALRGGSSGREAVRRGPRAIGYCGGGPSGTGGTRRCRRRLADFCKFLQRSPASLRVLGATTAVGRCRIVLLEPRRSRGQAAEELGRPRSLRGRRRRQAIAGEDMARRGAQKMDRCSNNKAKALGSYAGMPQIGKRARLPVREVGSG